MTTANNTNNSNEVTTMNNETNNTPAKVKSHVPVASIETRAKLRIAGNKVHSVASGKAPAYIKKLQANAKILGTEIVNGTLSPMGHKAFKLDGTPTGQNGHFDLALMKHAAKGKKIDIPVMLDDASKLGHACRLSDIDNNIALLKRYNSHCQCSTGDNARRFAAMCKAYARVGITDKKVVRTLCDNMVAFAVYFDLYAQGTIKALSANARAQKAKA